jgi:aminoglycoside 6'-N-acetyltransferase
LIRPTEGLVSTLRSRSEGPLAGREAILDAAAVENVYVIRPVTLADLPLLRDWRERPHVHRWWGDPLLEPEHDKLVDLRIAMWIAEWRGRPFAFIQDYDVHGWPDHHFGYLPEPSRGMDLYIGERDLIGIGHGVALIRQHVDQLFSTGVLAIGIDPHPDNDAAQRAYARAGFRVVGGPVETQWNSALLMERRSAAS